MNWNKWIRQFHRWVSIVFTLTVIASFTALALPQPAVWVTYTPLPPLFLLLFTGLYLFVLPSIARPRSGSRITDQGGLAETEAPAVNAQRGLCRSPGGSERAVFFWLPTPG